MVQQSFDQISSFLETLFFHLSARFYEHLILTMPRDATFSLVRERENYITVRNLSKFCLLQLTHYSVMRGNTNASYRKLSYLDWVGTLYIALAGGAKAM